MKDTDFAFACAKVRQLENGLLTKTQIESLINSGKTDEILSFLSSKGWHTENGIESMLAEEFDEAYETVNELIGDTEQFKVFVLQNDFHNLKAAVKTCISGENPAGYYIKPTSLELDKLYSDIADRNYDNLPEYLASAAKSAFENYAAASDGQAVDTVIDKITLETLLEKADMSESILVKRYAELTVAFSNIKIAYRGALCLKKRDFFEQALCGSPEIDVSEFARVAEKGEADVISFVSERYPEWAQALKMGIGELENVYEKSIEQIMLDTALSAFGTDPVIAYYWKKTNEIKNIRIILTCKNMGVKPESISERVRGLGV